MTATPKPLTKEEWERYKTDHVPVNWSSLKMHATLDQLFEKIERFEKYRERTRGRWMAGDHHYGKPLETDELAAELGIE